MKQAIADTRVELICSQIEPRWSDMDALGHINSLEYLGYMQECRVRWLMEMALSYEDTAPVLVNLYGEFKEELIYPGSLKVLMYGKQPGHSSFLTEYEVWSGGQQTDGGSDTLCATGSAKLVWIDIKNRRPAALPDSVRSRVCT